jgi:hypothetical protein
MIFSYMYTILKMTYNFAIRLAEQPCFHLCFPEMMALSSASPNICTGSSALRYGWSATAPQRRLSSYTYTSSSTLRYGLWASQGWGLNDELTVRLMFIHN